MKMHPADAERLEWLKFWAKDSGDELESAITLSEQANSNVEKWRAEHKRRTRDYEEFKSAMEGMKDGKYV